jgi:hypothetical protein
MWMGLSVFTSEKEQEAALALRATSSTLTETPAILAGRGGQHCQKRAGTKTDDFPDGGRN